MLNSIIYVKNITKIRLNNEVMSETNYYCPNCYEVTKHIRISASEFMSRKSNGNAIMSILGGINDLTGGGKLVNAAMGLKQWKCSKCCLCSQRKSDGTITGDLF